MLKIHELCLGPLYFGCKEEGSRAPLSRGLYNKTLLQKIVPPPTTLEHYFDSKPPLTTNQTHIQLYFILSPRTILTTYNLTSAPRPANCTHPYTSHLQLSPQPAANFAPYTALSFTPCAQRPQGAVAPIPRRRRESQGVEPSLVL